MPFTLPPLPYAPNALEPHIDKQTMEIHHDKHHAAYVTNLNKALEQAPALQDKAIEALLERKWCDRGFDAQLRQQVFYPVEAMPFGPGPPARESPVMPGREHSYRITIDLALARQRVRTPIDGYGHSVLAPALATDARTRKGRTMGLMAT